MEFNPFTLKLVELPRIRWVGSLHKLAVRAVATRGMYKSLVFSSLYILQLRQTRCYILQFGLTRGCEGTRVKHLRA